MVVVCKIKLLKSKADVMVYKPLETNPNSNPISIGEAFGFVIYFAGASLPRMNILLSRNFCPLISSFLFSISLTLAALPHYGNRLGWLEEYGEQRFEDAIWCNIFRDVWGNRDVLQLSGERKRTQHFIT